MALLILLFNFITDLVSYNFVSLKSFNEKLEIDVAEKIKEINMLVIICLINYASLLLVNMKFNLVSTPLSSNQKILLEEQSKTKASLIEKSSD